MAQLLDRYMMMMMMMKNIGYCLGDKIEKNEIGGET
jgi:hypothetical protein